MSVVELIKDIDKFVREIRDKQISDSDLEILLKELLQPYNCFHFRTIYRSIFYVVFVFECEKCSVEVRVTYCECNRITNIEYEISATWWKKHGMGQGN